MYWYIYNIHFVCLCFENKMVRLCAVSRVSAMTRCFVADSNVFIETLQQAKASTGRAISSASIDNYLRNLRSVCVEYEDDLCKLRDLNYLENKINSIPNINSRINVLFGVAFFIKHNPRFALEENMQLYQDLLTRFEDVLKNRKQLILNNFWNDERYKDLNIISLREDFISKLEAIRTTRETLLMEGKYIYVLQQYFIVSLYLFQEAQRNNYNELKYISSVDYN